MAIHTIISPNGNSCYTIGTPSSLHPGGVHVLMGDGSVRMFSENIDAGDPTVDTLTTLEPSPYGTWGALGSIRSGEIIGEF